MRVMLTFTLPVEPFNAFVRDGSAGAKIGRILEETRPEAVYFTDNDGQRTAILIVDLPAAAGIPALVEPWMLTFQAKVEVKIVMTPEDLKASGLDSVAKKY